MRDHLSVAAQGVDSRLKALQTEEENRRVQAGLQSALDSVGDTLLELRDAHQHNNSASGKLISDLQETLLNSFYRLGLTDNQEKFLQNMVGDFITQMAALLDRGAKTQDTLQRLNNKLGELRIH